MCTATIPAVSVLNLLSPRLIDSKPFFSAIVTSSIVKSPSVITSYSIHYTKLYEFILYEDEGLNYNYENGAFSRITLKYDHQDGTLVIGEREGQYEGMPEKRTFRLILVDREHPRSLDLSSYNFV